MSVDQMLHKMECYSHPEYRYLAKREILEDAIENKKYPFAPNRPFNLLTIDFDTDKRIPRKMLENKEDFKNLIK